MSFDIAVFNDGCKDTCIVGSKKKYPTLSQFIDAAKDECARIVSYKMIYDGYAAHRLNSGAYGEHQYVLFEKKEHGAFPVWIVDLDDTEALP